MKSKGRSRRGEVGRLVLAVLGLLAGFAQPAWADPAAVIEVRYTPVPRAQVAIWIEDSSGKFLATVALTEAVGYRGIGNRPGASQMNSGYRWPYGRREGVLPIWARRRASAPGARLFPRVVFQRRVEGFASQTSSDQSDDDYYCLQFDQSKSSRDELDAVSCATQFHSDKGRYVTQGDVAMGYGEPWQDPTPPGTRPLPLLSMYPPRMDVMRCTATSCFDHADVARFANDARVVMPDIDAVTRATAPGDALQKILFSVPASWSSGDYAVWVEVNVEGDYNASWDQAAYPTPLTPEDAWDYYAKNYGYPYRGQPSIAYKVPISLGATGERVFATSSPAGRSSWDHWAADFGKLEPVTFTPGDGLHMADAQGSGADRLHRDPQGQRVLVSARVLEVLPPPPSMPVPDGGVPVTGPQPSDASTPIAPNDAGIPNEPSPPATNGDAGAPAGGAGEPGVIIQQPSDASDSVGSVRELVVSRHPDKLRAHTWIMLRFRATHSDQPLNEYEVRLASEPIVDDASFIRIGRQAKSATDDAEGATALMLPLDVPEGQIIEAAIGDLIPDTHYFVAVRATDQLNRHGPMSVAEVSTTRRVFATVTPCFVASVAYGSPLAAEVDVLRQFRDRHLLTNRPGRALVAAYYVWGARAARALETHESLRTVVRAMLRPLVSLARLLP